MTDSTAEALRCPVCKAEQEWSDACRRCRADLRLVRKVHDAALRARQQALELLRSGQFVAALEAARETQLLEGGSAAAELVAVCALYSGQFQDAAAACLERTRGYLG